MFTVRFKKKAVKRSVMQTLFCGNSRQKRYCGKTLLWVEIGLNLDSTLLTRLIMSSHQWAEGSRQEADASQTSADVTFL